MLMRSQKGYAMTVRIPLPEKPPKIIRSEKGKKLDKIIKDEKEKEIDEYLRGENVIVD